MFEVVYKGTAPLMLGHDRLITWEDQLRTHPAYISAALAASRVRSHVHSRLFYICVNDLRRYGSLYTTILHSLYRLAIVCSSLLHSGFFWLIFLDEAEDKKAKKKAKKAAQKLQETAKKGQLLIIHWALKTQS